MLDTLFTEEGYGVFCLKLMGAKPPSTVNTEYLSKIIFNYCLTLYLQRDFVSIVITIPIFLATKHICLSQVVSSRIINSN